MGSCCSLNLEKKHLISFIKPTRLYYLNRNSGQVFSIEEGKFSKLKCPKRKINKNCAIGYLHDGNILIAGGIRPNGRISSEVLLINPNLQSITEYPSLAKPIEKAAIFEISLDVYCFSSDLSEPHQSLKNRRWRLMNCGNQPDLHSASVLVQERLVYFLCGIKRNGKPTKKIYYLDLDRKLEYNLTKHKLSFRLYSPIAYSCFSFLVLAGGQKLNRTYNTSFFIQTKREWTEVEGPDIEIENYPCLYAKMTCYFIGKFKRIVSINNQLKISVIYDNEAFNKRSMTEEKNKFKDRRNSQYLLEHPNNTVHSVRSLTDSRRFLEFSSSDFSKSSPERKRNKGNSNFFQISTEKSSASTIYTQLPVYKNEK